MQQQLALSTWYALIYLQKSAVILITINNLPNSLINLQKHVRKQASSFATIIMILNLKNKTGRCQLWHVKDMDNTSTHSFTEVGSGVIDFKKIFKQADEAGLKYFFVEQDKCPGSPFDSITKSYNYIKNNLV